MIEPKTPGLLRSRQQSLPRLLVNGDEIIPAQAPTMTVTLLRALTSRSTPKGKGRWPVNMSSSIGEYLFSSPTHSRLASRRPALYHNASRVSLPPHCFMQDAPIVSRVLCPSLTSFACRSSQPLLQFLLHTSLQNVDTTNTLACQTAHYRPEIAQFSQATSNQLSTTPRCSWHSGNASRGSKHPRQLVQFTSASYAHHPQRRKRPSGIDSKHSAIDA